MTKKEARKWGKSMGEEILADGDFTEGERSDEDSFSEAFWEIADNRKQYAGEITEDFRRDSEWEGYEEGLSIALSAYCRKYF